MTTNNPELAALVLMPRTIRLPLDTCGNPRYYLPKYFLPEVDDKTRSKLGLTKYRGKQFGAGYVIQSYNLKADLTFICEALNV